MAETMTLRAVSLGTAAGLVALAAITAVTMRFQSIALPDWSDPAPVTLEDEPRPPPTPPVEPIVRDPLPEPFVPSTDLTTNANFPPLDGEVFDAGPPEPPIITQPRWIRQPDGAAFSRHYPERAIDRGREGYVVLDCLVASNGLINCSVLREEPTGWGFGAAALEISRYFQMSPMLENGQPAEGGRVRVPISFRLAR